jgi:hypothetical protein
MAQMTEFLTNKHKALNLNRSTIKKKKKNQPEKENIAALMQLYLHPTTYMLE